MGHERAGWDGGRLDRVVAEARRERERRERDYRARALRLFPWVCARCGREFTRANLRELTVHHKNHDHDDNPPDGRNWELLCVYCHENEHRRREEALRAAGGPAERPGSADPGRHRPFAGLKDLLKREE